MAVQLDHRGRTLVEMQSAGKMHLRLVNEESAYLTAAAARWLAEQGCGQVLYLTDANDRSVVALKPVREGGMTLLARGRIRTGRRFVGLAVIPSTIELHEEDGVLIGRLQLA